MAVVHVTTDTFEKEVLKATGKVLVDFWADWCGPCKMIGPILDDISEERKDVKVCKVNVDDYADLAEKYNIMSIPALLYFVDGVLKEASVGFKPKEAILDLLK